MSEVSAAAASRAGDYRGHIAELDALRAIGIGIVLLNHFWPPSLFPWIYQLGQLGWIAMDSFFVLSGFLITGILVDTRKREDYYSNYYIRRSLRIFPLYYAVLLGLIVLIHLSHGGDGSEYSNMVRHWGSPAWFFFYLGNFRLAYMGKWAPVGAFGPFWSLQIEEQFYLLFPLAVRLLSLRRLSRFLWALVLLSPLIRVLFFLWIPHNPYPQFVLLPCHMDGLALGALIAIRFRSGPWKVPKRRLAGLTFGLLLLTAFLSMRSAPNPGFESWSSAFNRLAGISMSSFACAGLLLLLVLVRGSRVTLLLRLAPVQYIAKVSYGIYLLHLVASRLLRASDRILLTRIGMHLDPHGFAYFATVVLLSILLATISWYGLEQPLLRLKDRVAPKHAGERLDGLVPARS